MFQELRSCFYAESHAFQYQNSQIKSSNFFYLTSQSLLKYTHTFYNLPSFISEMLYGGLLVHIDQLIILHTTNITFFQKLHFTGLDKEG